MGGRVGRLLMALVMSVLLLPGTHMVHGQRGGGNFVFYVHSTGYFSARVPTGGDWEISESDLPEVDQVEAGQYYNIFAISSNMNGVVHYMAQPLVDLADPQAIIGYLSNDYWQSSWANYQSWKQTDQQIQDNRVVTQFDLVNNDVNLVAEDWSWVESNWLYTVRAVYPAESSGLLGTIEDLVVPTVHAYPDLQALPPSWPVYVDQTLGFMIKYPPEWDILDGNEGEPVTIASPTDGDQATIKVEALANKPITKAADAKNWLTSTIPTAELTDSAKLARSLGTGYEVLYKLGTPLNPRTGLAVLLNDDKNTLYAATLEVALPNLDLIAGGDILPGVAWQGQQAVAQGLVYLLLPE